MVTTSTTAMTCQHTRVSRMLLTHWTGRIEEARDLLQEQVKLKGKVKLFTGRDGYMLVAGLVYDRRDYLEKVLDSIELLLEDDYPCEFLYGAAGRLAILSFQKESLMRAGLRRP